MIVAVLFRIQSAVIAPDVSHSRAQNVPYAIELLKVCMHGAKAARMVVIYFISKNGLQIIQNVRSVDIYVSMTRL